MKREVSYILGDDAGSGNRLEFYAGDPSGVVQFVLTHYSPADLESMPASLRDLLLADLRPLRWAPFGGEGHLYSSLDLGYHSTRPMFDGHESIDNRCRFFDRCFYDGTALGARDLLERLRFSDMDDLWFVLREKHEECFASAEGLGVKPMEPCP